MNRAALSLAALAVAICSSASCGGSEIVQASGDGGNQDGAVTCGGAGQACCNGTACDNGLICNGATCAAAIDDDAGLPDAPSQDSADQTDAAEDAGALVPDFAWYLLDETSGTTAHDSSVNRYDITNLIGVTWSQGALFDSSVGVCGWTNVAADLREPPVTISAWQAPEARADSTTNDNCHVTFGSNGISGDIAGAGGYGFGINVWTDGDAGSGLVTEVGTLGCVFPTVGSFVASQEYFVALAADLTTATIYVAGTPLATVPAAPPPAASPTLLQLGCINTDVVGGSKRFFNGRMRDVRIYKRLLSATEVQQLYVSGPSP